MDLFVGQSWRLRWRFPHSRSLAAGEQRLHDLFAKISPTSFMHPYTSKQPRANILVL